jgi:hypothetical protein
LHDVYSRDHPGAVDAQNPAFRKWLNEGLGESLAQAARARTYGDYWWAMREYVAGFNDGHVFIEQREGVPSLPLRWPGFLTRELNGAQVVTSRTDDASLPALGSRLVSCDGVSADQLTADLVGRFRGRWNLASQREAHAWRLFVDASNPYVRQPGRCLFRTGAQVKSFELQWRDLPQQEFEVRSRAVTQPVGGRVEVRPFRQRGLWVSLGSFSSDPASDAHRALEQVVATLNSSQARLAAADIIVLDVRGNGGGSSAWGERIAGALWGEGNVRAAKPRSGRCRLACIREERRSYRRVRTPSWRAHADVGLAHCRGYPQSGAGAANLVARDPCNRRTAR